MKKEKYANIHREFMDYESALGDWRTQIKKDSDFFWGNQWEERDAAILRARGHAPIVNNRIFPIIEQKKAQLGQTNPSFIFLARGNGDQNIADTLSKIARFTWDTSEASNEFIDVLHNMAVYGVGYFRLYYDPNAMLGEGAIKMRSEHPLDVFFDPNIKKDDLTDSKSYFIYKVITKDQAIQLFPEYQEEIKNLNNSSGLGYDLIETGKGHIEGVTTKGDEQDTDLQEKLEFCERHSPENIPIYTVILPDGGKYYFTEEQYKEFISIPENKIALSANEIHINKWYKKVTRVQIYLNWELKLFDEVIDVPYPILTPFVEHNPQNGRFISDVRIVRSMQEEINKRRSLIIAHLTTQVNTKWIAEEGATTDNWVDDMANPSVLLTYKKGYQKPERVESPSLPNGLFQEEQESKYDIEYTLGVYDYMMGSARGAHPTARGIATLAELGNRRMNYAYYKLARTFEKLGIKILHFIKNYYTTPRIIRIADDELKLNIGGHDQSINIEQLNTFEYDITVSETTLSPTHRQAKAMMLKEYADQGYVRKSLVTRELDIPDAEKEAEVMDEVIRLSNQIKMLAKDNEDLQKNVRQKERMIENLQRQVELEKFRTEIAADVRKVKTTAEVARKLVEKTASQNGKGVENGQPR